MAKRIWKYYQLINETFVKDGDAFAGRKSIGNYNLNVRGGDYGIILVDSDLWKEHRRFALHVFKDFGMGRGLMEEKILCEFDNMLESIEYHLNSQKQASINIASVFEIAVSNIINQMLFGFSYHGEEKKKEFSRYKDVIARHMQMGTWPSALMGLLFFNTVRYLPYFNKKIDMVLDDFKFLTDYCKKQIEKHRFEMKQNGYDKENPAKDYVEAYLRESEKNAAFTDVQLINSLFDLWIAGQETTANTLIFSILYLLHNPEIQTKLHKELDAVIGSDRRINLSDKNSLIYVNAFINEVQRSVNLLPQNLLHRTLKDVKVGKYFIKKGTTIIPQISNVLYNENIFPEPQNFKPERFIDENGQLKKVNELVPFSIGKRQCLGESLARMELFLIISNFYNHFNVSPIDANNLPTLDKTPGITVQPKSFECNIFKRF
uniref:Cytochrome P450 n=1 Tax=Panagrolaimus superbus TaxID=310955 RepID=A0A914XTV3_9BILA